MSWATKRETTRPEDETYFPLSIFKDNRPLVFGGRRAFVRLQEEIIKEVRRLFLLIVDYSGYVRQETWRTKRAANIFCSTTWLLNFSPCNQACVLLEGHVLVCGRGIALTDFCYLQGQIKYTPGFFIKKKTSQYLQHPKDLHWSLLHLKWRAMDYGSKYLFRKITTYFRRDAAIKTFTSMFLWCWECPHNLWYTIRTLFESKSNLSFW